VIVTGIHHLFITLHKNLNNIQQLSNPSYGDTGDSNSHERSKKKKKRKKRQPIEHFTPPPSDVARGGPENVSQQRWDGKPRHLKGKHYLQLNFTL